MQLRNSRPAWLIALLLSFSLVAAGCGDDDETGTEAEGAGDASVGGEEGGDAASGTINISGSSTVEPISTRVAELFAEVNPDVVVNVDGPGTGDGFELFCNGETDISDASRAIDEEEIAACEEAGIEFIELKVGIDGLSVLTNPANEAVTCLTFEDLYALVGPESQGFASWSDAQPLAEELGSTTELPDTALDVTAPGEESGTYDSFVEITLEGIAEERGQEPQARPDYSSQADDNAIIQGIEGSESSFGWVGFAFAEQAGDGVKNLEIDGGEGCVAPTPETIADGSFPISRPLFIYVDAAKAEENPAIAEYVDYYLGEGISAVEEVGYVALEDDALQESAEAWEARETGTREAAE